MKIEGNYTFEAPREMVFQMLQDPEVLSKIIPGCEQLTLVGDNEYEAALEINVGPVKGKFKGKVVLSELNAPESYSMTINGNGAPGFVKGTGHIKLEQQGVTTTLLIYEGDAHVGGRIASVGQRLVESAAKALTKQSLDGVNQYIEAVVKAKAEKEAAPPPKIEAPTQTEFAMGMAKGVISDIVPPNRRPLYIGAAISLFILFIILRSRQSSKKKRIRNSDS
ncbi:carbon monoxide dehydrogenase subunit G [Candidatus Chlorohelix sp.]|uniref:SRPBCC family protein n=1 Tax=Candidatus Chlorohelix sp. TaxID=3139201 RepID=UPI00307045FF